MSFEEFTGKIIENLSEYFGDEVSINKNNVRKNNGIVLTGITASFGSSNISPTVYLENMYERYCNGVVYGQIMNELINIFENNKKNKSFDMSFFTEYEKVKKRIVFKLINYDKNIELLAEIPHIRFLDMAVCFYYLLSGESKEEITEDDRCNASILIYNTHADIWGVDADMLYECAKNNTPLLLKSSYRHIANVLAGIIADNRTEGDNRDIQNSLFEDTKSTKMYVLSNDIGHFGAAAILYDKELELIAEDLDSNFFVLPSSVHEVIILGEDLDSDVDMLRNMVREVNQNEVDPGEVLSDSVYYYDNRKKKLLLAVN